MANWSDPILSTAYATLLSNLKDRDVDCAKMDFSVATNIPTGTIQYVVASNKFQRWSGAAWVDLVLAVAGGGTGGTTALGTMAFQASSNVAITGGSITTLSALSVACDILPTSDGTRVLGAIATMFKGAYFKDYLCIPVGIDKWAP